MRKFEHKQRSLYKISPVFLQSYVGAFYTSLYGSPHKKGFFAANNYYVFVRNPNVSFYFDFKQHSVYGVKESPPFAYFAFPLLTKYKKL